MKKEIIIETRGLMKYFGSVHAVEDVNIQVYRGEVFGFLGPNGAGKTTTISLLLSLIFPTAGEARLFNQPVHPRNNQALKWVGALVGTPALIPYLTAYQNIELLSRLHPEIEKSRIDSLLSRVGLEDASHRKAGAFSTGMKQRLGLAMALLHKPELLILDEPTNGMDPAGMREIRLLLRKLAEENVTIFLSSHLLHEVEQICDRIAVLNKGWIVTQGTVNELLEGQKVVRVRVPSPTEAAVLLQERLEGVTDAQTNGGTVMVTGVESQDVVAFLVANGIIPSEVSRSGADLESLFLELTASE
jgi:ABC-type multidrug transport system ATPase subunit